jgi:hypothetical protein
MWYAKVALSEAMGSPKLKDYTLLKGQQQQHIFEKKFHNFWGLKGLF